MKFTKPTVAKSDAISVNFWAKEGRYWVEVSGSSSHPKDSEIRSCLEQASYKISLTRGDSYLVIGGTGEDLHKLTQELEIQYGLVEPIEDVALLSKIAIEVAIGASKTNGRRLDRDDFQSGFNAIDAAKNDGFMQVCLETSRAIMAIVGQK